MSQRHTVDQLWRAYRHCWWVVARSCDIDKPKASTLLDRPLVVFRDDAGAARVLDRHCIHRGADLAAGKITADGIECPYHGWAFDGASGACSRIPSLREGGTIPASAQIRSYPVIERFEHVWTCLEKPFMDIPSPPELEGLTLEWLPAAPIPAHCGYMAAVENFLDMSHFAFVHGRSMGPVSPVVPNLHVKREGTRVAASFRYEKVEGAEFSGIGDSWMHYHSYAPGFAAILYEYDKEGKRYLVDFPSPVSQKECVIYWGVAVDQHFSGGTVENILTIETQVFDEDTPILDGLQPSEVSLTDEGQASCVADFFTLNYRRATMTLVDEILDRLDAERNAAPGGKTST
jgi:phenylpropionate dioxygenase-like ring-hydroxylating dioxygenase large terminal subunit